MVGEKLLITRARQGDQWAFRLLYERYFKLLFGFVCKKINNLEAARDVTSETWLAVVVGLEKFSHQASFKNWLFGIAKHKIMDFYRQQYKQPTQALTPELERAWVNQSSDLKIANSHQQPPDPQLIQKINQIFKQLSPKDQRLLTLNIKENYSIQVIAAEFKMSYGATKTALHRALKKAQKIADSSTNFL